MAHLSLSLLGPFQVTLDGVPATGFEASKVQALLAYLAVRSHLPHRREALAGLLWPDRPDRAALASLRNALANLRAAIGDRDATAPFLRTTRETIQFDGASDHWLDVAAFRALVETSEPDEPADERLEEAVALYRGDFLEAFSVRGSPEFDDWALLLREQLQRQVLAALGRLIVVYEGGAQIERACEVAWRQVGLAPWEEVAHRQLMRLLAESGRRGAAMAQYEACRLALAEELGVEPSPETVSLYERIRNGAEPEAPASTPPHNLLSPLGPLFGREAEMAEIAERLSDPECRLLTVVGPGGIGKTRLALEAAANVLSGAQGHLFLHGVFFVPLAPLQSVEAIVPTVARAIDFTLHGPGDSRQQLLDYLREKEMLLLLDNFEHLLDGAELVIDILRVAPRVVVIVTSRVRLNARSEYLLSVAGMTYPHQSLAAREEREISSPVMQCDAVKLFLHSLRQVRPNFEPTANDLAHVGEICRLVEGMPLALLLAASWVQMLSLPEIAAQVRQSTDFLEADVRDLPERQRSLRAVFDHSWGLLEERQRERFAGLSVFRGGFTAQAAQEVAGVSLRELMALVNRSLLSRTPEGRYEVHELLRQYAADKLHRAQKLDASPVARETVQERHCAYYVGVLQRWEEDRKGQRQLTALAEIDHEIENARAAWDWARGAGHVEYLDMALEGLCAYYEWRGRYEEGESASRLAADRLAKTTSTDGLRLLARTLAWQCQFAGNLGRSELVSELLQRSREALEDPALADQDVRRERAWLLRQMTAGPRLQFDLEGMRSCVEQSLALCRELGCHWEIANLLGVRGYEPEIRGAFGEAQRMFEESLTLRRQLGDRRGIAESLLGLSEVARLRGQFSEAESLARESVAIYQEAGDRPGMAQGLLRLGEALFYSGGFLKAQALFAESLAVFRDLGDRERIARGSAILARPLAMLGQYSQARAEAERGLTLARETHLRMGLLLSVQVLCDLSLADEARRPAFPSANPDLDGVGEPALVEAGLLFEEWLAMAGQTGGVFLADALAASSVAASGMGNRAAARGYLCEAARMAAEAGGIQWAMKTVPAMALLLSDEGGVERAVELYALASRYGYVANSKWYEDVFGRQIAAAAASLPPDVVTAAEERGRQRDLGATVKELVVELGG